MGSGIWPQTHSIFKQFIFLFIWILPIFIARVIISNNSESIDNVKENFPSNFGKNVTLENDGNDQKKVEIFNFDKDLNEKLNKEIGEDGKEK
uniref:Uncharacterized protein n=1 Tax=Meloidogyne enterolobii TaxID=390850 RepID=A0A6V7X4U6_MELEN|nr:unnamed protein product [Meloidogyne enterolobii]